MSVPIKLGLEGDWLVSEARVLTPERCECWVERSIPLQSDVQVVMILPSGSAGKKPSLKIDCGGTVKSVSCVQDEKKDLKYQVEVLFKGLSASEKRQISDVSKDL